jgi:hypothetical protein
MCENQSRGTDVSRLYSRILAMAADPGMPQQA